MCNSDHPLERELEVSKTISMANSEQWRGEVHCAKQSVKALQSSVPTENPIQQNSLRVLMPKAIVMKCNVTSGPGPEQRAE